MREKLAMKVAELYRKDRQKFAELAIEYAEPGHFTEGLLDLMFERRTYTPGTQMALKVRKGLREVKTLVPGQKTLATRPVIEDRVNYTFDQLYNEVVLSEDEIMSQEFGSLDNIKQQLLRGIYDKIVSRMFTALSTVWNATNTPNNYLAVAGQINATALKTAIDRINQTAGGVRGVFGTRKALTPITEFGNFVRDGSDVWGVPDNIKEIMQTGWLGSWYGARIIAFEQFYTNLADYRPMLPENYVVVIGQNAGKYISYNAPPIYRQWVDYSFEPPMWHLRYVMKYGLVVDNAEGIFVIEIV